MTAHIPCPSYSSRVLATSATPLSLEYSSIVLIRPGPNGGRRRDPD
jgi:hypothetical protein